MLKSTLLSLCVLFFAKHSLAQCTYSTSHSYERTISPSDFGAVPNDTGMDHEAFQCAIDSAAANESLNLYIEPGLYYFGDTVFLSSNLILDGHFKQTTIMPDTSYKDDGPLFSVDESSNRLENVLITGIVFDADTSAAPIWGYKNMRVTLNDFTISNCEFINLDANLFFTSYQARRARILNNVFDNIDEGIDSTNLYGSVHLASCSDCIIDGNEFSGMGFVGNGSFTNHALTNNYFHDIGETSIFYRITDTTHHLIINGNKFENIKKIDGCKSCILVEGFNKIANLYQLTVNNNTFRDICTAMTAGGGDENVEAIHEELYIEGLSFQNNLLNGADYDFEEGDGDDINGGVGIIIRTGDDEPVVNDVIVSGNVFANFRTPGIRMGAADFIISDNIIDHTGIQDSLSSSQMSFHSGILVYKRATRGVIQDNLIKNIGPSNIDTTRSSAGIAIFNQSASDITIRNNTIIDTRQYKMKKSIAPRGYTTYGIDVNADGTACENILIEGNVIKNMQVLPVIGASGSGNATNQYLKNSTDQEMMLVTSSFALDHYQAEVGFAFAGIFSSMVPGPTIVATLPAGYEGYTFGPFLTNNFQSFELHLSGSDQFLSGAKKATLTPYTMTYAKCLKDGFWKLIKE
ncbi:MAG: hypothetical protein AAGA77_06180 [Bacteroidota bacterium]